MEIHVSNRAYDTIPISDLYLLASSYEDSNLVGLEEADRTYAWFEAQAPGQFHKLYTGDYITPDCGHFACEVYDNCWNRVALISTAKWAEYEAQVRARDTEWRQWAGTCKQEGTSAPEDLVR